MTAVSARHHRELPAEIRRINWTSRSADRRLSKRHQSPAYVDNTLQ